MKNADTITLKISRKEAIDILIALDSVIEAYVFDIENSVNDDYINSANNDIDNRWLPLHKKLKNNYSVNAECHAARRGNVDRQTVTIPIANHNESEE